MYYVIFPYVRCVSSVGSVALLFHLHAGYTHRMRLIPFAQRYFVQDDELSLNEAQEIAQSYQKMLNEGKREIPGKILYIGRKHVFFRYVFVKPS